MLLKESPSVLIPTRSLNETQISGYIRTCVDYNPKTFYCICERQGGPLPKALSDAMVKQKTLFLRHSVVKI